MDIIVVDLIIVVFFVFFVQYYFQVIFVLIFGLGISMGGLVLDVFKLGFSIVFNFGKFNKDEYFEVVDVFELLSSLFLCKKDCWDFLDIQEFFGESFDQRQCVDVVVDLMDKFIRLVYQVVGSVLVGEFGFDYIVVFNFE